MFKEGDSEPVGCHASRERALSQQRALYANESQTAAALPPTRIELLPPSDQAVPALIAAVDTISERLAQSEQALASVAETLEKVTAMIEVDRAEWREALTAAVQNQPPVEPPVVNVTVPEQAPVVHVSVPEQPAPVVNVELPAQAPRRVRIERSLEGRLEGAVIEDSDA